MSAYGQRILVFCIAVGTLFLFVAFQSDNKFPFSNTTPMVRLPAQKQTNNPTTQKSVTTDEYPMPMNDVNSEFKNRLESSSRSPWRSTELPVKSSLRRRVNMGECPPIYGKVTVFVAYAKSSYETDLFNDERVNKYCQHDQMHILQTVLPGAKSEIKACDKIWHNGTDYDTYMAFVTCVKVNLGAVRLFPGKLRILRRSHGFARDGYLTGDGWSELDFLLHGWKAQTIGNEGWESPFEVANESHSFTALPNVTECGVGYRGWFWRNKKRNSIEQIRLMLAEFERSTGSAYPKAARVFPYLTQSDIGECYPNCDNDT
ncbi:hypothetical protein M3Y96_00367400 [Aphelenchoides besseyi]|nr:hypothetical protein M3Y96_00367400 [Aphelenchoides besseyi]